MTFSASAAIHAAVYITGKPRMIPLSFGRHRNHTGFAEGKVICARDGAIETF